MTESSYVGGRIVRVKVKNFMIYENIEFRAKKGLNLIVGLNGSGKSTLMCAICLGLGGKAGHTGRASVISDFIKHGFQQAEIEIELESGVDETLTINRIIVGKKSEWLINNKPSCLSEVTSIAKKFNIDTGNLCQFLPQEKVVEFSKMDKKQRLENMLQAIGEPTLYELFDELKELQKRKELIEAGIKKEEAAKSKFLEKNERIFSEVKIQERRDGLRAKLKTFNEAKIVMVYEQIKDEVKHLKDQIRLMDIDCQEKKQKVDDLVKVQEEQNSEYNSYQIAFTDLSRRKKTVLDFAKEACNEFQTLHEKIANAKTEYEHKLREREKQEEKLKYYTLAINSLKAQLNKETAESQDIPEKLQSINSMLKTVNQDISQFFQETEKVQTERNKHLYAYQDFKAQLIRMKDESNLNLQTLKKIDQKTYQAVIWLQQNRNIFKSNIYLPIMLEISVTDKKNSKFIENHIGMRDFLAFVCEDKEDCKKLTEILCHQKKLPVNIVMDPQTPLSQFSSPIVSREMRNCGLDCFLVDLFTAPDPVMRFLCACYGVHNVPVSTNPVSADKIDNIVRSFNLFYAANMKISGKKSRYGAGLWSIRKDFISERNLLSNHDVAMEQALEEKLANEERLLNEENAKFENLRARLNEKEHYQESLRSEKKTLTDKLNTLSDIKRKIQQKEWYRQTMPELLNVEEEKLKLASNIMHIISERQGKMKKIGNLLQDVNSIQKEIVKQILIMISRAQKLKLLQGEIDVASQEWKDVENEKNELNDKKKEKTKSAKDLIPKITEFKERLSSEEDAEQAELINRMTIEELNLKIIQCEAELDISEDNQTVLREFREREKDIREAQDRIDEQESELSELKEEIGEKKKKLLEPLNKHINGINKKFMHYFKLLNCAGEISLDTPDGGDDFQNYGLQIKLKFSAAATFTELSHARNSGGECSVAAIIFILSLQELTDVPFRCIDEINQGMDSTNERRIYQLIADSVQNEKCSQYFLVTPKILLGLENLENVTFHIIHNSHFLHSKIDVKRILEIVKS